MMLRSPLRMLLLVLVLPGAAAAVGASRVRLDAQPGGATPPGQPTAHRTDGPVEGLDSVTILRNAFRADRRPAAVSYDPSGQVPPPVAPRPSLSVAGIVMGRTRAALLRGLPGLEGVRVVAEGEVAAGVRVLRVVDTAVIVRWQADTLTLPLTGGGS